MARPMKIRGFRQDLYEESADAKERVGTIRWTADGRVFRYSKNGAAALVAGETTRAAAIAANVTNQALPATAVGATNLTYTAGGAVTYAADYFRGGYLQINDGGASIGEGLQYAIRSSSVVAAGTTITIVLEEPVRVAMTTSSEATLVHNDGMAVIQGVANSVFAGIPPIAVTAAYYFWNQIGGCVNARTILTEAIGTICQMAAAGELETIGVDSQTNAIDADAPIVGIIKTTGVNDEHKPVNLYYCG